MSSLFSKKLSHSASAKVAHWDFVRRIAAASALLWLLSPAIALADVKCSYGNPLTPAQGCFVTQAACESGLGCIDSNCGGKRCECSTDDSCTKAAAAAAAKNPTDSNETFRPNLTIPIPGLSLTAIKAKTASGYIDVPWLAEYINGIYKYATLLAGVIATVMFMVGGFQYLTAGGDKGRVDAGKKRISDSVIGMSLVLGANLLLRTVNPSLTEVTPIRVITIPKKNLEIISPKNMIAATGSPARSPSKMTALALDLASNTKGVNAVNFRCFVYGSMAFESGGKQDALGHDENYPRTDYPVGPRQVYMSSGIFYSGLATKTVGFTPVPCSNKDCQNGRVPENDDKGSFDVTKPPEYGLDWRFSHGIGSGQSTLFPKTPPCPGREAEGRGFLSGGKCYTIPDLLDANKQAEAMIAHYKWCYSKTGDGANIVKGYVCYGGTAIKEDCAEMLNRVAKYNDCLAGNGPGAGKPAPADPAAPAAPTTPNPVAP